MTSQHGIAFQKNWIFRSLLWLQCSQTVSGLNLVLCDNTYLWINVVPWKSSSWGLTQGAHQSCHHSKHFMMCIVWKSADPSTSFAQIMAISLNLLPFNTKCREGVEWESFYWWPEIHIQSNVVRCIVMMEKTIPKFHFSCHFHWFFPYRCCKVSV